MRTDARIVAFKTIFASLFEKEETNVVLENILSEQNLAENDLKFTNEILTAFKSNKNEIQTELESIVDKYELDRIYKVDLALLYLAVAEIRYLKTPKPVAINETLEIAKKFSTDKSSSFINGILAKLKTD